GHLGDVRGIHALLEAYQSNWRPDIVAEAIAALGPAVIPELLRLVEERPALLRRATARGVFDTLSAAALTDAILDRLDALAAADAATVVAAATPLLELVKARADVARAVADRLLSLHPSLGDKGAGKEARALARKAAALRDADDPAAT
ncbi:MAG TPA: hypothetical protein VHE35_26755, partial [Kofleriaceae bacterium]|nr:hypothetical protein [Kofleriaceae bacterium]